MSYWTDCTVLQHSFTHCTRHCTLRLSIWLPSFSLLSAAVISPSSQLTSASQVSRKKSAYVLIEWNTPTCRQLAKSKENARVRPQREKEGKKVAREPKRERENFGWLAIKSTWRKKESTWTVMTLHSSMCLNKRSLKEGKRGPFFLGIAKVKWNFVRPNIDWENKGNTEDEVMQY